MFYSYHHCITTAGTESPLLSDKLLGCNAALYVYMRVMHDGVPEKQRGRR